MKLHQLNRTETIFFLEKPIIITCQNWYILFIMQTIYAAQQLRPLQMLKKHLTESNGDISVQLGQNIMKYISVLYSDPKVSTNGLISSLENHQHVRFAPAGKSKVEHVCFSLTCSREFTNVLSRLSGYKINCDKSGARPLKNTHCHKGCLRQETALGGLPMA